MNYVNDGMDSNPNYVNCMNMNTSQHSSMSSTPNVNSISLPEYVNVNRFVVSQPLTYRSRYIQQQQSMDNYNMPAFDLDHSVRRRSDNSVSGVRYHFPGRSSLRSNPKGRSMVDFTTMQDSSPYDSISDRQESWRRAKRFIHAFKQKSSINLAERDSNTVLEFPKSSSTGALRLEMDEINQGNQTRIMSTESMSELDDMPPSLDMAVNGTNSQDPLREKILFEKPPQGLIKLKEDVTLQPPSLAFKRSLFSQIRGSFSKYDGEKATHGYQQGEQSKETDDEKISESSQKHDERKEMKSPREPSPLDGISTAVNRRQDRMKEYDRRASAVSTHKNLIAVHSAELQKRNEAALAATARMSPVGKSSDSSGAFTTKHVFVHIRDNSLSHSESARSSNESLSSDARSKISIRKRTNSPPRFMAPQLPLPRQISANTLKPSTSSSDSMNSCQTTRSLTPPLPKRAEGADSSSSDESMINPLAYVRASIARRPLKKAMSLTKLPESNKGAKKLASAESCADKNNRQYSSRRNARRNSKKIFSSSAGTSHTNLAPYQS